MRKKALIVDLDGTYCNYDHRSHLWWQTPRPVSQIKQQVFNDVPHEWCQEIVKRFGEDHKIIFLTARFSEYFDCTQQWLHKVVPGGIDYELRCRKENEDELDDWLFKQNVYLNEIAPAYDVTFAIDDRQDVCIMWRRCGIIALTCADPSMSNTMKHTKA